MDLPAITVVTNLYNEEDNIPRVLRQLEQQTIEPVEVIVVDNGSTDATWEVLQSYEGPLRLRISRIEHVEITPARYYALRQVGGGVAVVVDADMNFPPNWLEAVRRSFEDPEVGASYSVVDRSGSGYWERGGQAVREVLLWVKNLSSRPWLVGHGLAIRADLFKSLEMPDHNLVADDIELSEAVHASGMRIATVDEVAIGTGDPNRPSGIFRRHMRVGRRSWHAFRSFPSFLLRASSVGRFWPAVVAAGFLLNRKLGLALEAAFTILLVGVMRSRGVPARDWPGGWLVFHMQTTAATAGFIREGLATGWRAPQRAGPAVVERP